MTTRYPIERHSLLRRSFVHLSGVGPRTEQALWRREIRDWDQLGSEAARAFKGKRLEGVLRALDESHEAWERGDLYHFHRALPSQERWRIVDGGIDDVAYFDIEADGGGMPPVARSTAIAFLFRGELLQEHMPRRKRELVAHILAEASFLCSYNGASYDAPFLAAEFGQPFAKAHVDLCPWLRRQGFKGGLKAIQKAKPHLHQRQSMDIDGYDAVRLWRLHEKGIEGALPTLLTYNAEDVLILAPLLVETFHLEAQQRPELGLSALSHGPLPRIETEVDGTVYAMLRVAASLSSGNPWVRRDWDEAAW